MQTLSYENEFGLNENEPVGATNFLVNGFEWKLVFGIEAKANSEMTYLRSTFSVETVLVTYISKGFYIS